MNLLTIVFVILVIWSMYRGLKSGFAKEVNGLVSLFMALVDLSVTLLLIGSILQKNTKLAVISVIMLTIVSFLYRLLKTVMHSIETVAELPVISLLNTIAGALAGGMKILVVFWIIYIIVNNCPTGAFGEWVMERTEQSTVLINIYHKNFIADWIMGLGL